MGAEACFPTLEATAGRKVSSRNGTAAGVTHQYLGDLESSRIVTCERHAWPYAVTGYGSFADSGIDRTQGPHQPDARWEPGGS